MPNSRPVLLDKDDVDAMTIQRVLNELKVTNKLVRKVDSEDALEYLRGEGTQKPCVILLDLNMLRMNGFEFLKNVKADENFRYVPDSVQIAKHRLIETMK
jgi:CheY-like chemotaxis protein